MNICFLTLGHVSKTRGGVDRVTDSLAQTFIMMGHKIIMVSASKPIGNDVQLSYQYLLPNFSIESIQNRDFLSDLLVHEQIDVVINQSDSMPLFRLLLNSHCNIPIVSVIHTDPNAIVKGVYDMWDKWKYDNGILKFLLKLPYFILRYIYQRYSRMTYIKYKYSFYYKYNDAIILLSDRFKKSFIKLAKINNQEHLYAIGNPLSYDVPSNAQNKEKIILFVGRLDFSPKRLDRLIKVWRRIKHKNGWKIMVIGDGPARHFYENMCKHLNLTDIEFLGLTNPQQYYQIANIICITSTHEGFCMVATEALQHEVIPIIFNSYEAVYDIISDRITGFIVKSFSLNEYKNILEKLMYNVQLRENIRSNIRIYNAANKQFNREVIARKWIDLLTNVANKD